MARVLVVDDDAEIRESIVFVLEGKHELVEATDGAHALDILARETFDVVLLDLMMPNVDGKAVLDELARRGSTVPVVVISAANKYIPLTREPAMRLGKPFTVEELEGAIEAVIRGPRGGGDAPSGGSTAGSASGGDEGAKASAFA